jgi:predicted  nucleic acid-binding Zn-ribbon protein
MSDGLKVNIEISAPTGEAQEAFAKVAEGVKQLADQIARQTGKVKDSFDITKILNRIRPWVQTLGSVKNKMEEAAGAALSWNKEVNGLSRTLGVSTKEASGLAKALGSLGTSSDAYAGAVSDLQRSLDAQEAAFNANGIATRKANGEMLGIQQVMMNTLKRVKEMKPGYDANALAMRQRRWRTYAPPWRRARCAASETARQCMRPRGHAWARARKDVQRRPGAQGIRGAPAMD